MPLPTVGGSSYTNSEQLSTDIPHTDYFKMLSCVKLMVFLHFNLVQLLVFLFFIFIAL